MSFGLPPLPFLRLLEKTGARPGLMTSGLGAEEAGTGTGDEVRRSCREGKRGLQLLLMLVTPPSGWFGEVRPEAMPSSSSAKESVSTARDVRSLSLDGPGEGRMLRSVQKDKYLLYIHASVVA